MLEQKLIQIGLSDKEAKVYLALAQGGSQPTSSIAKRSKLNRGTTYVALHSLLERKLVEKRTKNKMQIFTAVEPARLVSYVEDSEKEIANQKKTAAGIMEELNIIARTKGSKPSVQYFNGVEGVRAAYEDTLNANEKNLMSYFSVFDMDNFLGEDYLISYTKERIKRGYSLRIIQTLQKIKDARYRDTFVENYGHSGASRREVRYVDDNFSFPVTLYMYDDKVLIISSKEENFGLILRSHEFAQMQKKIFEHLWVTLKPQTENVSHI